MGSLLMWICCGRCLGAVAVVDEKSVLHPTVVRELRLGAEEQRRFNP